MDLTLEFIYEKGESHEKIYMVICDAIGYIDGLRTLCLHTGTRACSR